MNKRTNTLDEGSSKIGKGLDFFLKAKRSKLSNESNDVDANLAVRQGEKAYEEPEEVNLYVI